MIFEVDSIRFSQTDDSFAYLTRLSSFGRCGLAETVGLCFVLTPTVLRLSSSWISCVCVLLVFCCVFVCFREQQTAL